MANTHIFTQKRIKLTTLIRQANKADIDIVTEFDATDEKTVFGKKKGGSFISGLIETESAYIALVDNIPVGYARVDFIWPERVPLLSWLYIKEELRGKGLGNKIREYVFNSIQAKGYEAILRSACTERPHMIESLKSTCQPAGSLTFLNGVVEYFFWQKFTKNN